MAEYTYYLRDNHSQKETPIVLYIRYEKVTLKYPTGEKILPKEWNQSEQKKRKIFGSDFFEFNTKLENIITEAKKVFREYEIANNQKLPDVSELRTLLNIHFNKDIKVSDRKKELDLFGLIAEFIGNSSTRKNKQNRPISAKTIEQYNLAFNKLKAYQKAKSLKKLDFDHIATDFYLDFEKYLITEYKHSPNTIANNFKMLKVFFNYAHEKGYLPNFISKKLEVKRVETQSIYLNENEIEQLYKFDLSKDKKLERVRDLFIVGCWTGLRFSDLSKLDGSYIIGDQIKITTQKTNTKVTIPIHPVVKDIITKYKGTLPKAISNQKMNDYLKIIGEMAEINQTINHEKIKENITISKKIEKFDLITTHTARRSFASNMFLMGIEVKSIRAITGHSTDQAFYNYIKLERGDHANLIAKIWEQKGVFKMA